MKTTNNAAVLASLAELPGGSPAVVEETAAESPGFIVPVLETEGETERSEEYVAHGDGATEKEKKENRGRRKGDWYKVNQCLGTILRAVPRLKNFSLLFSNKKLRSIEEIRAFMDSDEFKAKSAIALAGGKFPEYMASITSVEMGGRFKLGALLEKNGEEFPITLEKSDHDAWYDAMKAASWARIKFLHSGAPQKGEEEKEEPKTLGLFTGENKVNDPTIIPADEPEAAETEAEQLPPPPAEITVE